MRKVLLVGLDASTTREAYDVIRSGLVKLYPDHEVHLVAGMTSAVEFTENEQTPQIPARPAD